MRVPSARKYLIIAILVSFFATHAAFSQDTLKMGYFGIPPHVVKLDDEAPKGAAVTYFNDYISPSLGLEVEWDIQATPPTRLFDQLKSGEKDAMIFLGKTEQRTEFLHYPDPYLTVPETLAFKKGNSANGITKVDDLYGLTIGFLVGGRIPDALQNDKINFKLLAGNRLFERNLEKLLAGRIDAVYAPLSTALTEIIEQMGVSDQVELISIEFLEPVQIYTVFSKKSVSEEFVEKYNEALKSATIEIEYLDYIRKYKATAENN